jgi:thymidylate synthase
MIAIKGDNMKFILKTLYKEILLFGQKINPNPDGSINRTKETTEIMDVVFELTNPRNNLMYCEKRKFNVLYALLETFMIFNGRDELKYFSQYNTNIGNFSDDGVTLRGSYGRRICDNKSIEKVINILRNDPNSRQAVIPIYEPRDLGINSKDIPCTLGLVFNIRNGKLNCSVYMRSSDAVWGIPYDVFVFTNIQMVIANSLGVELGSYTHHSVSMHIYEHHYETAREVIYAPNVKSVQYETNLDFARMTDHANRYIEYVDTKDPGQSKYVHMFFVQDVYKQYKNMKHLQAKILGLYQQYPWLKPFTRRWIEGLQKD